MRIERLVWRFMARTLVGLVAAWYVLRTIDSDQIPTASFQSSLKLGLLLLALLAAILILMKVARLIVSRWQH